ncbi:MAG: hypothetical protein M3Y91_17775 [Actinomycetota bacterium]|nr:hypothetical protein [Actinomycetota bacterium]
MTDRRAVRGRLGAAGVALVVGLSLPACGHHQTPDRRSARVAAPTSTIAGSNGSASSMPGSAPSGSTSTIPGAAVSSPAPPATGGGARSVSASPQSITATGADRSQLTGAFEAYRHLGAADVGGIIPGYLYLAHVPASNADLAVAKFTPSAGAAPQALVDFQDGGNIGVFRRTAGGSWAMTGVGGVPFPCPGVLPSQVQALWHLPNSSYCGAAKGPPG